MDFEVTLESETETGDVNIIIQRGERKYILGWFFAQDGTLLLNSGLDPDLGIPQGPYFEVQVWRKQSNRRHIINP